MGAPPQLPQPGGPGAGPSGPPQGGPPPGAGGAPSGPTAQPTPAIVQIVSGISQLAQMLAQVYPPGAPSAQKIMDEVNQVQSSMAATQSPAQTAAPPI